MLGLFKRKLREAVDRRVMHLMQQNIGGLARDAMRGDLQELRSALGATAAPDLGSHGWTGQGDPFAFHTHAAASALAEGVAACYGFDVDGHIAEFGTMTGGTARGLARAMASCDKHLAHAAQVYGAPRRELHLFDSFEGLPAVDNAVDAGSPHVQDGIWPPGSCRGLTPEQLRAVATEHLADDRVRIFQGWFADTVPALPAETRYALIHVDGDLYVSAMDVLVNLFARGLVAKGAYIYFDDWSCNRADPHFGERRAWRECVERFGIDYSDQGPYAIFCRRFTVHDYRPETKAG
jgi:O-methyltransferase